MVFPRYGIAQAGACSVVPCTGKSPKRSSIRHTEACLPSIKEFSVSRALFDEMRRRMELFRRSEQKVARFVLRNPDEVIHMRIVDLATEAKVSEPTVVRFCRALGCNGFQDFKLKLAQMLASGSQFAQFSMNDDDSVAEFSQSIFDSTVGTLLSVRDRLDNDAMSRAIQALALANQVEFYGFGASGAVAFDAQHKFFRLQISTAAYADPQIGRASCRERV